jgi:hypothetical protein
MPGCLPQRVHNRKIAARACHRVTLRGPHKHFLNVQHEQNWAISVIFGILSNSDIANHKLGHWGSNTDSTRSLNRNGLLQLPMPSPSFQYPIRRLQGESLPAR